MGRVEENNHFLKYSLTQERRWKGEDLPIIQSYFFSLSPKILTVKDHNVTNMMNEMIIWFYT